MELSREKIEERIELLKGGLAQRQDELALAQKNFYIQQGGLAEWRQMLLDHDAQQTEKSARAKKQGPGGLPGKAEPSKIEQSVGSAAAPTEPLPVGQ